MTVSAGGVLGRGGMPQGSKGLEVYFSNPDFVFANEFATPRFGQGALAIALKALLHEVRASATIISPPREPALNISLAACIPQRHKKLDLTC